ncbi:MAG: IS4 family transposase [Anaerolineae bacterium]
MKIAEALANLAETFSLAPFDTLLQPLIDETLKEQGKDTYRRGTVLVPRLLVWLVLVLTLRRDLNYDKALNWMVSGLRWLAGLLPAQSKLVSDGAISHARVKLGVAVFRALFVKQVSAFEPLPADFYGRVSVAFDGSTGTMPDSAANQAAFGKPSARQGQAAFPQVRLMTLLAVAQRRLLELAWAPYRGKGRGERALMAEILERLVCKGLLFLLDAGLYSFDRLWHIQHQQGEFIGKAPLHVKPKLRKRLPDGSWLAEIQGKIVDPDVPAPPKGRRPWKTETLTVRVIHIAIPRFRPFWLMTNLLDPTITAREIALHYHQRWDIEIAYDEIKTHQCAALRGQSPTTFRSKLPDLVQQELYALAITYNAVRTLICQAAHQHAQDPRLISFLDTLQHILDAAPILTAAPPDLRTDQREHLLALIADCRINRPRRPRLNPRVVKVKMSKFARKNSNHKSQTRDIVHDLTILEIATGELADALAA